MSKDSAVIKVLTQLKLRPEPQLSDEEEKLFARATNDYEDHLQSVEDLFKPKEGRKT